jgi:lipid-A-disaccharide synthase
VKPLRIGIIAGEASGDILGSDLIAALRERYPNALFEGIAGPRMMAQGCTSLFPMEALSVMGISEVLRHLPRILSIRRQIIRHLLANPPDLFIGIDAPDFNLGIELKLRKAGILTTHYNSPSVWAWKENRIHKIKRAVDLMLLLFPFEISIYEKYQIPACFVGHPMADTIPLEVDRKAARKRLNLAENTEIIALLPGSRHQEIQHLGETFLRAALYCLKRKPHLQFIAPMLNPARRAQFEMLHQQIAPHLPLRLLDGHSHDAMAAADLIVLASGTATLEAMLLKRPMVVAYRTSSFNYWLAKYLVKLKHFALPNILAGKTIVPELLQAAATPERVAKAIMTWLTHPRLVKQLTQQYNKIHCTLRCHASQRAVEAISTLLDRRHMDRDNP